MAFAGGEFGLIRRIRNRLGAPGEGVILGIGDDAAVLALPPGRVLATIDMLVEDVHFDLSFIGPRQLGAKAMAVNLSDIAAMGGRPLFALVSLGAKADTDDAFVEELYGGMAATASSHGVQIVGGDTVRSPGGLVIDVAVLGVAERPITRRGARPGDIVAVTGDVGTSAAGLNWLLAAKKLRPGEFIEIPEDEAVREVVKAHLEPVPRVREAALLSGSGMVTAMIDVSDGLASEVHHIAEESGVGMVIYEDRIPVSAATREIAKRFGADPLKWALEGGEDYQLLLTCPRGEEEKLKGLLSQVGTQLTCIGEVVPPEEGVTLVTASGQRRPLLPGGYDHFRLP